MANTQTIRERVTEAIVIGLGGSTEIEVTEHSHDGVTVESHIQVPGHAEPIVVKPEDVVLPDWALPMGPGIMLDVQAILSDLGD